MGPTFAAADSAGARKGREDEGREDEKDARGHAGHGERGTGPRQMKLQTAGERPRNAVTR